MGQSLLGCGMSGIFKWFIRHMFELGLLHMGLGCNMVIDYSPITTYTRSGMRAAFFQGCGEGLKR
jgi:hypothetical protein